MQTKCDILKSRSGVDNLPPLPKKRQYRNEKALSTTRNWEDGSSYICYLCLTFVSFRSVLFATHFEYFQTSTWTISPTNLWLSILFLIL